MEQRSNLTKGQGSSFTVNNCPTTIPDVDNDCDKKLNQSASVIANKCTYNSCAPYEYIRRDAYMSADGDPEKTPQTINDIYLSADGYYNVEGCGMRPICIQTKRNNCNDRKASWQDCVTRGAESKQDSKALKNESKFGTGTDSSNVGSTLIPGPQSNSISHPDAGGQKSTTSHAKLYLGLGIGAAALGAILFVVLRKPKTA